MVGWPDECRDFRREQDWTTVRYCGYLFLYRKVVVIMVIVEVEVKIVNA